MTGEGVTTRFQKEVNILQQEMVKVQGELSQMESTLDPKFEVRLLGFKEEFKFGLPDSYEQYFGSSGSTNNEAAQGKGKGILRRPPPSFPLKETGEGSHHETPSLVEGDPNHAQLEVLLERNY
ncbi:hypothetical protein GOBAR_DD14661 [Gossypium barbadense]|nr:hypothetical protein GOBAR_DD14661 [Gossypium barbadense]